MAGELEIDVTPDEVYRHFEEAAQQNELERQLKLTRSRPLSKGNVGAPVLHEMVPQATPPKPGTNDGGISGIIAGARALAALKG